MNTFDKILVAENWQDIGSNDCVSTLALFQSFHFTQHLTLSSKEGFHKNTLTVTCCTFSKLEIRTLTPNRLKNQASNILKLLDHDFSYQQVFFFKKMMPSIVAVLS